MKGLKDMGFLQIPIEWNSVKLGSEKPFVLEEIRSGLTNSQNKDGGNYKVSRIETISESIIDDLRVRYISEITKEKIEKYLIKKGDILFSHINSDPHLGKTAIAKRDYDDLLHGMNLLLFRANEGIIKPEFLNYIFNLYKEMGVFIQIRSRAVNQSSINQNKLKNLEIPLPELPEQRKIAHVLNTVQKAIEQQDKLIRTTTELKKALMQKLFTEGTRGEPQKETEIGLVPESWKVVELGKCLLKTQYGLSVKGNKKGNVPILRMTNQKDGYISNENLQYVNISEKELAKFKVNIGDVIFNRTNSFELVGRTAIFKLSGDYVFASYLIRLITNSEKLYPEFLNSYLNADETQNRLKSIATRGVSQSNISATRLRGFVIPLLSLAEQIEIISTMKTFNHKIEYQNKKKQTLTDLFKTLLHELMTGQRRVHELEFENMEDF